MQARRYRPFEYCLHAGAWLAAGLLVLSESVGSGEVLLACPGQTLRDWNSRGFYLAAYPGTTLETATLEVSAYTAGSYTLQLTVRSGSYDGPILGSATNSVMLDGLVEDGVAAPFAYGSIPMPNGGTVCFILSVVSGPETIVFYNVGGGCAELTETQDTTPPLSVFKRSGVKLTLTGQAAEVPQLAITPSGTKVVLSWPTNAAGFTLQSTTNLVAGAMWGTNRLDAAVVGGRYTVTNPVSGEQQFYRLSK